MYESLLCLPFFQGMSKDDITEILGKVTLEFKRHGDGDVIFRHGEPCDKFIIITQGKATSTAFAPDKSYTLTEELTAPIAIEPHSTFGNNTNFKRDYIAKDECTILYVDKQHLFGELKKHDIFTINLLNQVCRRAQQKEHEVWNYNQTSIAGKIARFIAMRCDSTKGEKHITIKMERLATLLGETRLNISKSLNEMQEAGYLTLHRGGIAVHNLSAMIRDFE